MTKGGKMGPVVLQGVGRLGSAILEGWLKTGAVDPVDLIILTPSEKPAAEAARALGARINPPLETLAGRVAAASPGQHPVSVAQGLGNDEVGAVARVFDALLARTHDFIA